MSLLTDVDRPVGSAGQGICRSVARSLRLAVEARLPGREMRLLAAVLSLIAADGQRVRRMSHTEILDLAFTEPSDTRSVQKALRNLRTAGCLQYEPGDGRGNASIIGLPEIL